LKTPRKCSVLSVPVASVRRPFLERLRVTRSKSISFLVDHGDSPVVVHRSKKNPLPSDPHCVVKPKTNAQGPPKRSSHNHQVWGETASPSLYLAVKWLLPLPFSAAVALLFGRALCFVGACSGAY